MSLKFYGHPFSLYCQKVLIALYEYDVPFEWCLLAGDTPQASAEFAARWPLKHMPMLVDGDRTIVESTILIEYLGLRRPASVRLVPADAGVALDARMMDRFFDCYVSTPVQKIVFDALRPQAERDARGVADARACSTRRTRGSSARSTGATGPRAARSPWPIARPRLRCSMRTGRIRSIRRCSA